LINNQINQYIQPNFLIPICLGLLLSFCSCKQKNEQDTVDIVASVGNIHLPADELSELAGNAYNPEDSVMIVREYVNTWIRKQLMVKQAETDMVEDMASIDKLVADYRNSLLIHKWQEKLALSKINNAVTPEEIEKYYADHAEDFILKDNIIKCLFVKLPPNAPDIHKARQWLQSDKNKDKESLKSYCFKYASNFYLEDNVWLLFSDILKEIPIKTYDHENYLRYNRYIEVRDSTNLYLLNIKGFKTKETTSPLSFEKENIKNIILNKRKVDFIRKLENDLFEQAKRKNEFEINI
jgi:hypothetical protein